MNGPPTPALDRQQSEGGFARGELLLLGVVLLAALLVRLWLIPGRWVNPDEGAHLMDGRLILEGLVPAVDFGSRAVIYSYLTSLAVWTLGTDVFRLRLFPVAVTLTAGVVIYLIGRRTSGWRVGVGAAALFLLLPFSALMTVHTKTEPLAILSAACAVYFLVRAHFAPIHGLRWTFASGVSAGAAFYIRESTLAILAALLVVVVVEHGRLWKQTLRSTAALLLGMIVVTAGVGAFYLRFLPLGEVLTTPTMNPIAFVVSVLGIGDRLSQLFSAGPSGPMAVVADAQGLTGLSSAVVAATQEVFARADRLDLSTSVQYFSQAATTSAILGIGAGLAAILTLSFWLRDRSDERVYGYGVPLAWVAMVGLAYAVWTVKRGFYPAYFLELTPSLALLTAAALGWCWTQLPARWTPRAHLAAIGSLTAVMGVVHVAAHTRQISLPLYFVIAALVLGVFHLPAPSNAGAARTRVALALGVTAIVGAGLAMVVPRLPWIVSLPLGLAAVAGALGSMRLTGFDAWEESRTSALAFAGYTVIAASLFVALSDSASILGLRYQAVWTPESVGEVSALLRENTPPDGTVISGAVIWELEADRVSYGNVSHPLGFLAGISDNTVEHLREELRTSPPSAIVLDSRTERTWLAVLPELDDMMRERFQLIATIEGPNFPVSVYVAAPQASAPVDAR